MADFEAGCRHNLPAVSIMDEHGTMNEASGAYAGLHRFAARKRILADLESKALLRRTEAHEMVRC